MAPSRRRSNSSLFESSTIITANLIMASSSYLLSRITPHATASPTRTAAARAPAWSSATSSTCSAVEPMAGCRTVLMEPINGQQDGKVDQQAENFIRRFRERTQSETARLEAAAAVSTAASWPPEPKGSSTKWAGTVHRYSR
ncbi:unnamed protein product [Urochloa decumbens]|uniref:Uncharacterized protein n=1 Tax=Urochloa decumbens TaxID=240449 RepID=A0ABC9DRL4_9POAL